MILKGIRAYTNEHLFVFEIFGNKPQRISNLFKSNKFMAARHLSPLAERWRAAYFFSRACFLNKRCSTDNLRNREELRRGSNECH
jgi:hypothetical protein